MSDLNKILREELESVNDEIISIAKEYLDSVKDQDKEIYCSKGMCGKYSMGVGKLLIHRGFSPKFIRGKFELDNPDMFNYDDDETEDDMYSPLHFWLEIDNKILDVTADQFNDEIDEDAPEIVFDSYSNQPRYIKEQVYDTQYIISHITGS